MMGSNMKQYRLSVAHQFGGWAILLDDGSVATMTVPIIDVDQYDVVSKSILAICTHCVGVRQYGPIVAIGAP